MSWNNWNRWERLRAIRAEINSKRAASAADVARALGVTRNTIIGMCNRWDIILPGTGALGARRAAQSRAKNKPSRPPGERSLAYNIKQRSEREPVKLMDAPESVIDSHPITLMDTRLHHCMYPLWDDSVLPEARLYCGGHVNDGSYCDVHKSIVYREIS